MKKLLIFDMDGTIFDTEALYARSYIDAFDQDGVSFTIKDYARDFAGQTEESNLSRVIEIIGDDQKGQDLYARAEEIRKDIYQNQGVDPKEGLSEVLEYLKDHGMTAVLASSSDRQTIDQLLKDQGLQDTFLAIVSGDDIENSKPHPEIFLKALDLSGFEKDQALVIEDSQAGVEAGFRAGIDVIMVPDLVEPRQEDRQRARLVLDSLRDLVRVLDQL